MILLLAHGKRGYAYMAYNLAFSIKLVSNIPICIYHDGVLNNLTQKQLSYFDEIKEFKSGDAGILKTQIYDLSPYESTLYLDLDVIALKDLTNLVKTLDAENFYVHITGEDVLERELKHTVWAYGDDIWNHFLLTDKDTFYGTNTSIIWFKKNPEIKKIFDDWKANINKPIPLNKLRNVWGGTQPDELYLSGSLAQNKVKVSDDKFMFFGNNLDNRTFNQLIDDYYFLTVWGGRGFTRPRYTEWYDRTLMKWHNDIKEPFSFKYGSFIGDKHANKKSNIPQVFSEKNPMVKAVKPISESIVIDSSKLIQSYTGSKRELVKVTNWFNSSICEFEGKIYFSYRMECVPFCRRMKIGLCLLDKNYQPIENTNSLLELHSGLPGFAKGFHVEDPRLFVHNEKLYLSYTDGYQMAQAKINTQTLQAEESFYIEKPSRQRVEKNWTFFDYNDMLYSVYQITPHVIFEIKQNSWQSVFRTNFTTDWKWGELRGGASPIKVDGNYVAFFHSSKPITNRGKAGRQYFMGCYVFEGQPPFRPIMISKEPIIAGELMDETIPRLSNKIYVVFPSGVIRKKDSYDVSFGYNDYESRVINITDNFLESNLKEIVYETELV